MPKETSAKRLQQIETVEIAMQHKSNAGTPQLAGSAAGSRAAEAGAFYPRNPKVDVVVWKTIKCSEVKDVNGKRYSTAKLPAHKQVENNCDSLPSYPSHATPAIIVLPFAFVRMLFYRMVPLPPHGAATITSFITTAYSLRRAISQGYYNLMI